MINWQPSEFVRQVGQQELNVFMEATEKCHFLLVPLEALNSELALGLLASDENRSANTDALAFRTVVNVFAASQVLEKSADGAEKTADRIAASAGRPGADRIPDALLRAPCHVVPIRKRFEGSFLQNVSIGRARNNDIVLRHSSVSKFHALIEIHDGKHLMVKDSDSRNHTYVDGQQVVSRVEVSPGQTIRFGSVDAYVCSGESLWRALQG
jgi:hypothetical protein